MQFSDQLTILRETILNDRTDRVSGTSDYLWSDTTLKIYINEAYKRFARRSLALHDSTSDQATKIVLVAGQTMYALHSSVIAVVTARAASAQADLNRVGHSLLSGYRNVSDTWIDPNTFIGMPPGVPVAFSTDEQLTTDTNGSLSVVNMRIFPTPRTEDAGRVIQLRVVRKPLVDLVADTDVPEVAEDHHLEMLNWAAYLALRIVDDDAGAPRRAAEFQAQFEAHVAEARYLAMRKLFAPMPWGFGRGGFSWSNG